MYLWRDREIVLDMMEELTGNRIMSSFVMIGGVRKDLSNEIQNKVVDNLKKLSERIKYYRKVYYEDPTIIARTKRVGLLPESDALKLGTVGPVARASGINIDVRKDDPHAAYGEIPFNVITSKECDVLARLQIRVEELFESISIIDYAIKNLPAGPFRIRVPRRIVEGEAVSRVEAPRGELLYYVKSNGSTNPDRVKVRTPSLANIPSLLRMFKDCYVADIPAILVSIDPCFSCTDRMTLIDTSNGNSRSLTMNDLRKWRKDGV
ncbi:MAG: rane-bound hydrogenase subunit alpha, partial [Thermoproteota archaeon]|nr:rane-bound hydrogenase subunit alpha [Thermoproteota archaeon]